MKPDPSQAWVESFEGAFIRCRDLLGLQHYHVTFEEFDSPESYAETEADASSCIAVIRFNRDLIERDGFTEETAAHECAHLLMADLRHAFETGSMAVVAVEEERIARRLEPLLHSAAFPPRSAV